MADHKTLDKKILGGKLGKTCQEQKRERFEKKHMPDSERVPDFPPGPAAYNINPIHTIPGFVIKQPEGKVIGHEKR
jgi:hypothetical protein